MLSLEREFSVNKNVLSENLVVKSQIAQHFVIDYKRSNRYQPHYTKFTKHIMDIVKQSHYHFTEALNEK